MWKGIENLQGLFQKCQKAVVMTNSIKISVDLVENAFSPIAHENLRNLNIFRYT
jgi:hypothetical protein